MKGIILAGGSGSRLYPTTWAISKHLIPVYDKPMIYYPLSVLMLAGIREILIISTPSHIDLYKQLFSNGKSLGLSISYKNQNNPRGLADAFIVGEDFISGDKVALILGDNIFYGQGFTPILKEASTLSEGAVIFGYYVSNPQEFGVVEFNENGDVLSLEEKPARPRSNYVVPGLYFYDESVVNKAKTLKPSTRGELEITDLNKIYLRSGKLKLKRLGRGFAWLDTGTYDGLLEASTFIRTIQKRQGMFIACVEEIAYNQGFIDYEILQKNILKLKNTEYGEYLKRLEKRSDAR